MTGNTMPYLGELYVELTTRKLALNFNEDIDCIYEVYNSWLEFFSWCREQMKDMIKQYSYIVPIFNKASKVDYSLTATEVKYVKMYNLYLECMEIMRPHIEKYSHDFRAYFENYCVADAENLYTLGKAPKKYQLKYNFYNVIVADIALINKKYQYIVEEIVEHIIKYGD